MSGIRNVVRFFINWFVGAGIAFVMISLLHRWIVEWLGNRSIYAFIFEIEATSDESVRNEFCLLVLLSATCIALIDPLTEWIRRIRKTRSHENRI